MTEKRPLPEFESPPVDEVALGVDFGPIEGWKVPYAGLFWRGIRNEYPHCDVQLPAPQQIEQFPATPRRFGIQLGPADPNAIRCWFLDEPGNQLIQVQPDRFLRNWRRVKGDETYPRYTTLRPRFERDWARFCEFLQENRLTPPQVMQCEATYLNNIEKGVGWETFADLPNVTPLWSGSGSDGFLPAPESAGISLSYSMDGELGRLRVSLSHAIRVRDGKEILQFELVARGKPASSETADVMSWLDRGREWIVRAFADLTTPAMHKIWRRKA